MTELPINKILETIKEQKGIKEIQKNASRILVLDIFRF
jgi:hypothetical protein